MLILKPFDFTRKRKEALAVFVSGGDDIQAFPILPGLVAKALALPEFKGENGDALVLYDPPDTGFPRGIFRGVGKREQMSSEGMRQAAGDVVRRCMKMDLTELWMAVPSPDLCGLPMEILLQALMEGAFLANHLFDAYKSEKKLKPLRRIGFFTDAGSAGSFRGLPERVSCICGGTLLARNWVNTPSNEKRPEQFAAAIGDQAEKAGLKVRILDEKALKRNNFGALLAVGAGSDSKPRVVLLEHNPEGSGKSVALVGKGVTFDTGGINLKESQGMEQMKSDMSGAAAVAATLITLARLGSERHVRGIIPMVENMPSGSAVRPGDVVRTHSGKTVEIGNTDAEGRLILIDAISYSLKTFSPDVLIDLATLTGACVVALGEKIAGLFSPDQELAAAVLAASDSTDERCWRMPLPEDYKELLKSEIADIRNIGSTRYGGAITAALFIRSFAEGVRWAHIDIAGPAFAKKESAYCGAGGTGFGVRLLCDLLGRIP